MQMPSRESTRHSLRQKSLFFVGIPLYLTAFLHAG